jgi:hypothetical protein
MPIWLPDLDNPPSYANEPGPMNYRRNANSPRNTSEKFVDPSRGKRRRGVLRTLRKRPRTELVLVIPQ